MENQDGDFHDCEEKGRFEPYWKVEPPPPQPRGPGGTGQGYYAPRPPGPGGKATFSLIAGIVGLTMSVCCCGGGWIGIGACILAWVLGQQELNAIRTGWSSPEGYGYASAGRVMGIVGVILSALMMLLAVLYYVFVIAMAILNPSMFR